MNILITGSAGFIGFHIAKKLLANKKLKVIGIDNINSYYDKNIKKNRNKILKKNKNYIFFKLDLNNFEKIKLKLKNYKVDIIIHLAAQAGVRYSLVEPRKYLNSNIVSTFNILEIARIKKSKHTLVASSSSVYGMASNPFKENLSANHPIQFYAATKKSAEIICHSYSELHNLPISCLRYFTVYGPFGRPDMALFKFVSNIKNKKKIDVYNKGTHQRDFTYIDDAVYYTLKLMNIYPKVISNWKWNNSNNHISKAPFRIVNIASGKKISLKKFINEIEKNLNIKAKKNYLSLQKGDMENTFASIKLLISLVKKRKYTPIKKGIKNFIKWHNNYYK
tara:strand:- start:625 stop:1629 length:1005 start_codon:yes stop_codon:yes gene_type:complete